MREFLQVEGQTGPRDLEPFTNFPGRVALWAPLDEQAIDGEPRILGERRECGDDVLLFHRFMIF